MCFPLIHNIPPSSKKNDNTETFEMLWIMNLLTYSMVHSPSWEANWFAARQEIPRIWRNLKVHYRTHKRLPPVSILGQPNPVHLMEIGLWTKASKYCGRWLNTLMPTIFGLLLYFVKFVNAGWSLLLFLVLYLRISLLAVNKCLLSNIPQSSLSTHHPTDNLN